MNTAVKSNTLEGKIQTKTIEKRSSSTVLVENVQSDIIKCTARKDFIINDLKVNIGDVFYLVRSSSDENRYYVVVFANYSWTCSCGAKAKKHSHNDAVNLMLVTKYRATQKYAPPRPITDLSTKGNLNNSQKAFSIL